MKPYHQRSVLADPDEIKETFWETELPMPNLVRKLPQFALAQEQ